MTAASRLFPCILLGGIAALGVFGGSAQARPYAILHDFAGGTDGGGPYTPPVLADSGSLYGVTNGGGPHKAGTIYRIAPDGTETVLHAFDGAEGGDVPDGSPTIDPVTGTLYGTTLYGGNGGCEGQGCGILWKMTRKGRFAVVHTFDGTPEGGWPAGQLVRDSSGNFYGAAGWGRKGFGTVYRYGADGRFKVIHTFSQKEGGPNGQLTRDGAGNFYGATFAGGAYDGGTVYKLAPDGTYTVLHAFAGGAEGAEPLGGLTRDKAGNLYGTAGAYGSGGYGTAFKLTPSGEFTVLHAFTGEADGGYPQGDLIKVGKHLYGTTDIGGDPTCSCGLVFKMTLDGKETVLHAFTGGTIDGNTPFAGVSKGRRGMLYGTTFAGGSINNNGVVFRVERKQ